MKLCEEADYKTVTTTRYVLDANSLITYALLDDDGNWQFYSDDDIIESDICITTVKEMLDIDDTLSLIKLEQGQASARSDADSSWTTVRPKKLYEDILSEDDDL